MKRLLVLFILCLLCCTFAGCTVTADRIYTLCKYDGTDYFYFKDDGTFWMYHDGMLVPHSGVGLQAYPALCVNPMDKPYSFEYILPGLYKGTLQSVWSYISEFDCEKTVQYQDWNTLDVLLEYDTGKTRIIYTINGDVRIYAVDNLGNSLQPLYINE